MKEPHFRLPSYDEGVFCLFTWSEQVSLVCLWSSCWTGVMFSCLLTEGHARDMKGMFVTYLGSNIEALVYHKSTVLLGFAQMQ